MIVTMFGGPEDGKTWEVQDGLQTFRVHDLASMPLPTIQQPDEELTLIDIKQIEYVIEQMYWPDKHIVSVIIWEGLNKEKVRGWS